MVAANLHFQLVEVPVSRGRHDSNARPKDLLPWADPYIAGLVHKLKAEIMAERSARVERFRQMALSDRMNAEIEEALFYGLSADLEPPLPDSEPADFHDNFPFRNNWPLPGEIL